MKLSYLDLFSTDAALNLAVEQYLFDELPKDQTYLMLWRNRPTVVIGKYQNAHAEINAAYVRDHQIPVVRRLSGGGAVYHDLGNLNFTFISDAGPSGHVDLSRFCRPVVEALHSLGVPAELNGRNDICIEGCKCSGNAQYVRHGRVMHHGTLLFDSDLDAVDEALCADAEKLRSKGVASVRSRVTNLRRYLDPSVDMTVFRELLLKSLLLDMPGEALVLSESDFSSINEIKAQRYDRWEWNYGRSPAGSMKKKRRIEGCGTVTACFHVEKGILRELSFQGDFFSTQEPSLLAEKLLGCTFCEEELASILARETPELYISGMSRKSLVDLLLY